MSNVATSDSYLLVPINVEALVAGASSGRWTDLSPDFSRLYEGTILGSQVAPRPFDAKPQGPPAGIHLHWALPDALTRGRQERPANAREPLGAPEFPLIPNRWMVQRISQKPQTNEIAVRAWIIESDSLWGTSGGQKEDAATFPMPDTEALFDYVGKPVDHGSWNEKHPAYQIPLTALGYGDPAFAAFYPACKSVLGFHDPVTDIDQETAFAYLVAGWYSDPASDILRRYDPGQLKWACSRDANSMPSRTLCHGTIYNVQWKSRTFRYESRVPDAQDKNFRIAVGNTTSEALAALLAQELDKPGIEILLAAFQEDELAKTDLPEIDFSLHQQRFGSLAGGREFAIQKKQAQPDQQPSGADATLPEGLEKALLDLNSREAEVDRLQRRCDAYRWELYSAWHKWANEYTKSREEPTSLSPIVAALKQVLANETLQLTTAVNQRNAAEFALRNTVEQQFADLDFVASPAAPFWFANDPVVLITGPELFLSARHGQDGRYSEKDQLRCRVTGEELAAMIVDIPNGQAGVIVKATETFRLTGDPFTGGGAVPTGITSALLYEALLLNLANAGVIAEQAYVNAKLPTRPGKDELIGKVSQLQRPPTSPAEPPALTASPRYSGAFPSPVALHDWEKNPWLPLFLSWKVAWSPSYANAGTPLEHWQLDTGTVDFRWTGNSSSPGSSQEYEGYTIMTPMAILQLKDRLRKYTRENPDQDLSSIITYLDHKPVLGQALGGLNDFLIMRDRCMQITPINPAIFAGSQESPRDPIVELVKGSNFASPDPEKPFLPIRAGHMKVLALSIVDAFGQTLQLRNLDNPVRAASLLAPGPKNEQLLSFPPRLIQPLRLCFDWSPTANPPGTFPYNHPVCGWVIPNHLDKSLTFYDGRGTPWGALQKILRTRASGGSGGVARKDDKSFFWVPMPGSSKQPEDILNPHLKRFIQFLRAMDADTGTAYWNLLDEALSKTDPGEPEDDPLLSILLGRPLALARAELRLEISGLPASDQGVSASGKFDSKGFTKIKFPVQLGEAHSDNDGLIGFFVDAPQADASGPFYPAAGAAGTPYPGSIEYGRTLSVDCETSIAVTLLMDPRAKVHAITGILPRKAVTLPPRVSSAAKSAREAFFQVAPLVSPAGVLAMPRPSDDYGKWSWAYRPQVTIWKELESVRAPSDLAGFATEPLELSEGWLKLRMNPVAILEFWIKEGTLQVQPNTNITLGWATIGGDRISLSSIEDGKDPLALKEWTGSPLPEEWRVQVRVATTFILVLQDKDGNRSEKRLTVTLKGS